MHVRNVLHAASCKYRTQKIAILAPLHNFVGLYLRSWGMYRQSEKNLLNSNSSCTCPHNMVNFGLLTAEICTRQGGHHVGHWPTFLVFQFVVDDARNRPGVIWESLGAVITARVREFCLVDMSLNSSSFCRIFFCQIWSECLLDVFQSVSICHVRRLAVYEPYFAPRTLRRAQVGAWSDHPRGVSRLKSL